MRLLHGLLLAMSLPLWGWGAKGHLLAAKGSLHTLPPNLRAWFQDSEQVFLRASLEPDSWKDRDPREAGRHRIECDAYGGASKVPLLVPSAQSMGSSGAQLDGGQLPWVIAERYHLLVKAFQSGDPEVIATAGGWLCHYIADAQVPLHTTRNRNGKLTGQKGVHKRWERDLMKHAPEELRNLRAAEAVTRLPEVISGWISDSHSLVEPLLKADRLIFLGGVQKGTDPDELFWKDQEGTVLGQLRRSAEYTGDLLLTAWREAGKPLHP